MERDEFLLWGWDGVGWGGVEMVLENRVLKKFNDFYATVGLEWQEKILLSLPLGCCE